MQSVKEEATPRVVVPARVPAKSPKAWSRASSSPVARPPSPSTHPPSPLQHPPAVETSAPMTPPEPTTISPGAPCVPTWPQHAALLWPRLLMACDRMCVSAVVTPAPAAAELQDDNLRLQLECAALRLEAAERRFKSLADATEAWLRQLGNAAAPLAPADRQAGAWGSGVGVGFLVGMVFGFGAAAALSWGGGRTSHSGRGR